ncbi:hypothetical protein ACFSDD_24425 [Salipiger marinus]|uniref:hypothetical protein n=1 Tax=Salipiger marinus TaxID=555512 RepID=UPI002B8F6285|nr:hypothetical protein [Salipiger manganoxidans]MEB3421124.1 hypothetical protein [Salipiger manganoxidans]
MRRIFLILACSLTGATFASAGQVSVINPPNIVVPTPPAPPPVVSVSPTPIAPSVAPGVDPFGGAASGMSPGGVTLLAIQSFDVGQLSPAQMQEAAGLMRQMLNRGGLSPMQRAVLRSQLADMNAEMAAR